MRQIHMNFKAANHRSDHQSFQTLITARSSTPSVESSMRAWAQQPNAVRATSRRRCVPGARAAAVHEYTTHPNWAKLSWPRSDAAGSNVTLTTQCSLDRWPAVQRLLRSWDGQLSAAVYIPAPAGTPEAAAAEQLMQQCVTAVARGQDTPNDMTSSTSTSNLITHSAGEGHALLRQYMADQDLGDRDPTPPTPQPAYDQLYPINALRNLALEIADSPLVLPLDADFVPSRGAAAQAEALMGMLSQGEEGSSGSSDGGSSSEDRRSEHWALVLPPFEMRQQGEGRQQSVGTSLESASASLQRSDASSSASTQLPWLPRDKLQLLQAWEQGHVDRFHCGKWAPLQESIDYQLWVQLGSDAAPAAAGSASSTGPPLSMAAQHGAHAGDGSSSSSIHGGQASAQEDLCCAHTGQGSGNIHADSAQAATPVDLQGQAYPAAYHEFWEPVCVVRRAAMPLYDARFKGYGLNKVQHAYHLAALGFRFLVLRDHFVVTVPHARSPSFQAAFGTSADSLHKQRVEQLYQCFKAELEANSNNTFPG